jgi:hypothetical protein
MNSPWQEGVVIVMLLGAAGYLGVRAARRLLPRRQIPGSPASDCGGCGGCKGIAQSEIQLIAPESIQRTASIE